MAVDSSRLEHIPLFATLTDALTITNMTNGSHGTVAYNNNGTFTYTPNSGYIGPDSFTYTIKDGDGDASTATVTLGSINTNSLPTAGQQSFSIDEDGGAPVLLNGNQPNPGGPGDISAGISFSSTLPFNFGGDGPAGTDPINFANLNGTISGWAGGLTSTIEVTTTGAIYTGLAINTAGTRLYAADSAGGHINMFDSAFAPVSLPGSFADPNVPATFVPFNVQDIAGKVYVTYAPAGLAAQRAATPGMGAVSVFDENGVLQQTLINGSQLAAPWAVALAPAGFGKFGGDLLVGNFSFASSVINAFDPLTGAFAGSIPIDVGTGNTPGGLWGLMFGSGAGSGGDANTLYFLDGINGETAGLFGAVAAVPEPEVLALMGLGLAAIGWRKRRDSAV